MSLEPGEKSYTTADKQGRTVFAVPMRTCVVRAMHRSLARDEGEQYVHPGRKIG